MPPGAPQTRSRPRGMLSGSGFTLGRIMGINVRVDWSWVIIFTLITLMTSTQFKAWHEGWSEAQHWSAGIVTSLLFFVCIFLHEMGHSVVAKTYGIEVSSITLFIFGGVASIKQEPKRPCEQLHTVRPQESLERVMQRMDEYGVNQLPVVEQGVFYGLVTRETIVRLLHSRMEFGN